MAIQTYPTACTHRVSVDSGSGDRRRRRTTNNAERVG